MIGTGASVGAAGCDVVPARRRAFPRQREGIVRRGPDAPDRRQRRAASSHGVTRQLAGPWGAGMHPLRSSAVCISFVEPSFRGLAQRCDHGHTPMSVRMSECPMIAAICFAWTFHAPRSSVRTSTSVRPLRRCTRRSRCARGARPRAARAAATYRRHHANRSTRATRTAVPRPSHCSRAARPADYRGP